MRFSVLGPLLAQKDDGSPLTLPRPSQRSTLAVLLLHAATPPPRGLLIDAIWGDYPPADADTALRVRMSDLRRALGNCDRLVTHQSGYRLVLKPGELDSAMFRRLAPLAGSRSLEESAAGGPPRHAAHGTGPNRSAGTASRRAGVAHRCATR